MADDRRTLPKSAASAFSIWDVANIFEYATSRLTAIRIAVLEDDIDHSNSYQFSFVRYMVWEAEHFVTPSVNMCAAMNISMTMPLYLSEVLLLITSCQTEPYDHSKFFAAYKACPHQSVTHPVDINRVVPKYKHAWWEHRFDLLPFNMPLQISVAEPRMALMVPRPITHTHSDDPLMQQLQVLRAEVARLGMELTRVLVDKLDAMTEAVAAFNRLEDPVDELREAMEASHAAVAVLQEDYDNGWLGASPSIEPFPHPARLPC
ncbi:hypothetical protein DFJ58DRAFT_848672 [Suillus subalutaceus]|uniref:uncharacterized protein n=1 Tax=Suillus subalutaceus TaxID=48586 RepID=UPI001B86DB3E|nr:uncharacterized protein DFJ58DRAFT_848672 [Suillus subalutaceus]KAG1829557.1 hypothetical protein DFJ58DRAFT_848672 [Suillus subalutaceus]